MISILYTNLVPSRSDQTQKARKLRKESTHFEEVIWYELRARRHKFKWRRQVPFDRYIADFCCHEKKIILELDGDSHVGNEVADAIRDAYFVRIGYRVIRFDNNDVRDKLNWVLSVLWDFVEAEDQ